MPITGVVFEITIGKCAQPKLSQLKQRSFRSIFSGITTQNFRITYQNRTEEILDVAFTFSVNLKCFPIISFSYTFLVFGHAFKHSWQLTTDGTMPRELHRKLKIVNRVPLLFQPLHSHACKAMFAVIIIAYNFVQVEVLQYVASKWGNKLHLVVYVSVTLKSFWYKPKGGKFNFGEECEGHGDTFDSYLYVSWYMVN